jgi:hypothetical protein
VAGVGDRSQQQVARINGAAVESRSKLGYRKVRGRIRERQLSGAAAFDLRKNVANDDVSIRSRSVYEPFVFVKGKKVTSPHLGWDLIGHFD